MNNQSITKQCVICGNPVLQRPRESMARFLKKQTCSPACGLKYRRQNGLGWGFQLKEARAK